MNDDEICMTPGEIFNELERALTLVQFIKSVGNQDDGPAMDLLSRDMTGIESRIDICLTLLKDFKNNNRPHNVTYSDIQECKKHLTIACDLLDVIMQSGWDEYLTVSASYRSQFESCSIVSQFLNDALAGIGAIPPPSDVQEAA